MTREPGIRAQIEELSRRSDLTDVEKFARYCELAELETQSLEEAARALLRPAECRGTMEKK